MLILILIFLLSSIFFVFVFKSVSKTEQGISIGDGNVGKNGDQDRHLRFPPGPRGWPVLGNLPQLGSKPHQTLHALSKIHGPLLYLRLGSVDVVVASSAAVAEQLLRGLDSNFSNRPANSGAEHIAYNYQDLVFAPYGPRWRTLRRLCSLHLFSAKALDSMSNVRHREVARLVSKLHGQGERRCPVALGAAVNACATNALAVAMLGRRVFVEKHDGEEASAESDAASQEFKMMVVDLMKLAGVFNVGDFVPWLKPLDLQGVVKKMKALHHRFDGFLDRIINDHRAKVVKNGAGDDDFLSVLLRLKEDAGGDGAQITDTEIKALLLNLFTAGTDTTASTVEWAVAELLRHPHLMSEVQKELDAVVGPDRLVSESDLPNLTFTHAVVKETFRLHPPTPLSLPRIAAESCSAAGFHIPRRATLLVNLWSIARDPATWRDPLEFRPARFLAGGEHAGVDVKGGDFELIPFGAGRRVCAGMSLGIRVVQHMIATLLHAFRWESPSPSPSSSPMESELDMEEAYGLTLHKAIPLSLTPIARLHQHAYHHLPSSY